MVSKTNSHLIPVFIVNRLIIKLHAYKRVIPDWNIRKIRGLFFEITVPIKSKIIDDSLKGLSKYRSMALFFLEYIFRFRDIYVFVSKVIMS